jgi:hypothetical protein
MSITLNSIEQEVLFRSNKGTGGFQNLIRRLRRKLNRQTGEIDLSAKDLEQIPRYAFDYKNGGWEQRLIEIFRRNLGSNLGRN